MNEEYCQSCAMPMDDAGEMRGTNADGSRNGEYCKYCFENGAFTKECTMEEMIEFCIPYMTSENSGMSEEQARKMLHSCYPSLKRWKGERKDACACKDSGDGGASIG